MNPLLPTDQLTLLFLLLTAACGWSAWKSSRRCRGLSRWGVPLLRVLALGALAAIAFNPGRWQADRTEDNVVWAVLLDSSASMGTVDAGGQSRWQRATQLAGRLPALAGRNVTLNFFHFDTELHAVRSAKDLTGRDSQGAQTDLVRAGQQVLDRFQSTGQRLAGLLVFTDGRQVPPRAADTFTVKARAAAAGVYPLVLGRPVRTPDLALSLPRRQYVGFPGQPLAVRARLASRHLGKIRPTLELLDAAGKPLAEQTVTLDEEGSGTARFEIASPPRGYAAYQLRVRPWAEETRLANNTVQFGVFGLGQKVRVLMLEGTPYWDSKFIAQLLQRQPHVDLDVVYRLTQDRFFNLGSPQAAASNAVAAVFPSDAAALNRYDLVVAGKGLEYFLNAERLALLQQFVREHGGGLVFARGKAYSGELPELASLEPVVWRQEWRGQFRWQPTAAGEAAGLFGDQLPGRTSPVWQQLPLLSRAYQSTRRQAFAQVLAQGVVQLGERTQQFPVVVSQRYGNGLAVVVNSDDLWQWDFFPEFEGARRIYQSFWQQLMNWAVVHADFLPGYDVSLRLAAPVVQSGQPVRVLVRRRGATPENWRPVLRVFRSDRLVEERTPAPAGDQGAEWAAMLTLRQPGTYRVELNSGTAGEAEAPSKLYETLAVKPPPAEQDDLSPDRPWLADLAARTEGKIVTEPDLASLLQTPPAPEWSESPEEVHWEPLWNRWVWLVLLLGCFTGEWFWRRRNGLT